MAASSATRCLRRSACTCLEGRRVLMTVAPRSLSCASPQSCRPCRVRACQAILAIRMTSLHSASPRARNHVHVVAIVPKQASARRSVRTVCSVPPRTALPSMTALLAHAARTVLPVRRLPYSAALDPIKISRDRRRVLNALRAAFALTRVSSKQAHPRALKATSSRRWPMPRVPPSCAAKFAPSVLHATGNPRHPVPREVTPHRPARRAAHDALRGAS